MKKFSLGVMTFFILTRISFSQGSQNVLDSYGLSPVDPIVDIIDESSFERIVGSNYYKDKNNVYSSTGGWKIVDGADVDSIILIPSSSYAKDKNYVYYQGNILAGADASSFRKKGLYAQDKQYVYFLGEIIVGADVNSFEQRDGFYAVDKDSVFLNSERIIGTDPDTREAVDYQKRYSRDKNSVYYEKEKLEGSNPYSFELLEGYYSRDNKNVYYLSKPLIGVDWESFEVTNNGYSKDVNSIFYGEKKLNISPNGFNPIDEEIKYGPYNDHLYYITDDMVVFQGKILEGVKVDGFKVVPFPASSSCPNIGQLIGSPDLVIYTDRTGTLYNKGRKINILKDIDSLQNIQYLVDSVYKEHILLTDGKILGLSRCDTDFHFLPELQEKIDTIIEQKLVPNIEKDTLENMLEQLVDGTENYIYGNKSEAIKGAFYRHLLRNIETYY